MRSQKDPLVVVAVVLALFALAGCSWTKAPTAPENPIISTFTAEPLAVKAGAAVTLRWEVSEGEVSINPGVGTGLQRNGSAVVVPMVTTTYTLNARGSDGGSSQRTLTVTVTP